MAKSEGRRAMDEEMTDRQEEADPFVLLAERDARAQARSHDEASGAGKDKDKDKDKDIGTNIASENFRLTLTAPTVARLQALREKEQDRELTLRVRVHAGGCSGYRTEFLLDKQKTAHDLEVEQDGVRVLIDKLSAQTLGASRLDFESSPIGQQFRLFVEKAHSACGCGVSFAL